MTTRFVRAGSKGAKAPFDSKPHAARRIGDALKVAKPGDVIEILDNATYREGELTIDIAVTLTSSHLVAHPAADPTDPAFKPIKLPLLTVKKGKKKSRVLLVTGTPATRSTAGPVVIRGLRIAGGHAVHSSGDRAQGAGGGIAVVDHDRVTIERCVISGNHTQTAPIRGWPEPDRLAFRAAVLDLVGEIVSPTVELAINGLITAANVVLKFVPRAAPLPSFNRSTAIADIGKAFDRKLGPGRPNHWLGGQAFGGGIASVWASPTLRRCRIHGNTAQGRGAGVGVVGYGWPTLEACLIDDNHSGSTGRRDGGGIGCEVALPGKLPRDLAEIDLVKFLTAKLRDVKKLIGSPLSSLSIGDLVDYVKWLLDPTRPNPAAKGIKAVLLDLISGRFDEALDHLFYFFASSALSLRRWEAWDSDEIDRARRLAVTVTDGRVVGNSCVDDGGGLYASVLSRVRMTRVTVANNTATGSGGGVRLTMGSAGELVGCRLSGNTAIVDDPMGKQVAGGGGLSARNVDLALSDTRIGPAATAIAADSNVCSDHAGGGVAFQSDTEGMLAGVPDLWTAIMVEVFGIRSTRVEIKASCSIAGNGAGYDPRRLPMSGTAKAKGGGIWLLQGGFPDAPRVDLTIEAVSATVRGNVGQTRGYASKITKSTIATADQVCIQDVIGGKEWTEANFGSLLSGGTLRFRP